MGIKKAVKKVLNIDKIGAKDSKRILEKVDGYSRVSFDIFDTLIKRDVPDETSIFEILQKKLIKEKYITSEVDFVKERKKAEQAARIIAENQEVTLDEIYEQLECLLKTEKKHILEEEEQLEIELCTVNPLIRPIYDYCIQKGIDVYIISDMYLSKKVIEKILQKNGYTQYKALYVSCENHCSKRQGKLYDLFLEKEKIEKGSILHIGDNMKTDILQAKKHGFAVCKIPKDISWNEYFQTSGLNDHDRANYRVISAFINNRESKISDQYERLGYEVFGPLLYGFTDWICRNIQQDTKLYFVSRDGYIVKKAYEVLKKQRNISATDRYLYISRRSLYLPSLNDRCSLENAMTYISVNKTTKADVVFERFGISKEKFRSVAKDLGINPDKTYTREALKKDTDIKRIFDAFSESLKCNAAEEYKAMNEYFKQQDFNGNVVLIDIGWRGSIQRALEDVKQEKLWKPYKVYELYLAIRHDAMVKPENAKGYLVNFNQNNKMLESFAAYNALIEMFFSAPHGSVNRYKWDSDRNESVIQFDAFEYRDEVSTEKKAFEIIQSLQRGALLFVEDFSKSILSKEVFSAEVMYQNLLNFGTMVKRKDAETFGDFPYHDTEVQPVAKPDSLYYYLLHPKKFKYDFATSAWRVAFLKRMLKIKLPYYKIFCFLYRKTR